MTVLSPDDLLTTTRAVRRGLDLDRPVPLSLVTECLTIALQAPSGGNRQGWHWLVVTDRELRARIGTIYRKAFEEYSRSLLRPGPGPALSTRDLASAAYLADNLARVPVLVLACLTTSDSGLPDGSQASFWGSVLPAAWSYQLAARSRGLGTAWTTVHLRYEADVASLLGLPGNIRQAVMLPTAFARDDGRFRRADRAPLAESLHINGWTHQNTRGITKDDSDCRTVE